MSKLTKEHEAARMRAEAPIDKANKAALNVGDDKVIGCGVDGKGSKGHCDKVHTDAKKLMGK